MMRLRSGLIGSMSAWLPSRRSTAHQRGAVGDAGVRPRAVGQIDGICSWYGRYLWIGMPEGFWEFSMVSLLLSSDDERANNKLRDEEGPRTRTRRGD